MSFGPRVLLLLFFGLVVALLPVDGSESDLGASAAVVDAAQATDAEASQSRVESALLPDGLVLSQAFTAGTSSVLDSGGDDEGSPNDDVVVPSDDDVAVLGTSITNDTAPELAPVEAEAGETADVEATTTTTVADQAAVGETTSTATTQTTATTTGAEQTASPAAASIEDQMLALVDFDWENRFPEWEVEFDGARASIRGLTYPGEKRIELFIRNDDTPETLLRVFTHELGHVIDVELNTNEDRRRWREQRGIGEEVPWWPSAEAPDFETGAGDFAEAFAVLETGVTTRSLVSSQPTAADLALLQELTRG